MKSTNRIATGLALLAILASLPASLAAAPAKGIAVVDALGRTVSFDKLPERLALTGKAIIMLADAAYLFPDTARKVAAIGRTAQGKLDFIPVIDTSYAAKMILDNNAGPEQVAAARPDAIILKSSLAQTQGKAIEALGIPVVYLDFETPDQYWRDLATMGKLLGNEARAQELIAAFKGRLKGVQDGVATIKKEEKPRVLLLQYSEQGGAVSLSVPPLVFIQTMLVQLGGGVPAWKDAPLGQGWTKVSIEQIAAWDADRIFIIAYASDPTAACAKLRTDPQWAGLRAVKTGKLNAFPVDYYSWDQPDPRWILGLEWLAKRMNPDRFQDLDIMKEIQSFYKDFFGLDEAAYAKNVKPFLAGDLP
jgi:iron complex transport system substrate-binding protein